jgi:tRNA(fMet)-specific endonuclease VapC
MNGTRQSFLIDTNTAIALIARKQSLLDMLQAGDVFFVSSIVLGELYYGAQNSARVQDNLGTVAQFAADRMILACDTLTAEWYGKIKKAQRSKGRPIPDNDIWIAATALQYDLILLTRDAHFNEVEGLTLLDW